MHIDKYTFGSFVIDGKTYDSDIKIVNNKILFWKNHDLSIKDINGVVNAKPKPSAIIIGTGASGVIQVGDDIKKLIKGKEIKLFVEITPKACELYNELSKNENVAAILHVTC